MGCSSTSKPATLAPPSDGGRKQVRMRMVVVFPATLGPRKPPICPFSPSKEIWSTATVRAYFFVRPFTVIIDGLGENYDVWPEAPPGRLRSNRLLESHDKNIVTAMSIDGLAHYLGSPPARTFTRRLRIP